MKQNKRGFSLIELLVVISIILLIAAIAIPKLLLSRMAANQAAAVESCRVVNSSEIAYLSTYGRGYASTMAALGPSAAGNEATFSAAGLIDGVLAAGLKSGYRCAYAPTNPDPQGLYQGYQLNANPAQPGSSGHNYYYTDQNVVIRWNDTQPASAADLAISN